MRIRGKYAWLAVAIVTVIWWRHGSDHGPVVDRTTTTTAAQSDLARFIAHMPTLAQLKAHPLYIEPGTLRLEGQTIDEDKHPIGGAKITLNGSRTTVSEADGSFAFDKLLAADYIVTAEKDTFYGEDSVALTGDSDPDELEMRSGPVLKVHVVDHDGNAIRDAAIDVRHRSAVTDLDGNATLRGIAAGEVRVEVAAAGFGPDRIVVATGDDPHATISKTIVLAHGVKFGGIVVDEQGKRLTGGGVSIEQGHYRDRAEIDEHGAWSVPYLAAGKVSVSATASAYLAMPDQIVEHDGAHEKLDVVIHVKLGARATGIVVDPQGHPVADALVSVGNGFSRCGADGRFLVEGFEPGLLEYSASNEHGSSVVRKAQIDRTVDLRIELVDSSIAGIVRDPRGEPVEDTRIEAKGVSNGQSAYGSTDEFGKFDLGGIPPGDYEVFVQHGKDRMSGPAHGVITRTTNRNLALVIANMGSITGHVVLDGAPVDYFGVAATDDPNVKYHLGTPDPIRAADGAFVLKDLHPGTYTLAVVGSAFTKVLMPNLHVTDGGVLDLGEIRVERGRIVRGTVRDGSGKPIAGAVVTASPNPGFLDDASVNFQLEGTRVATTDALGTFEVAGLDPAESEQWIQAVRGQDMAPPRKLVTEDAVVELVITRTGAVAGRLINARDASQGLQLESVPAGISLRTDANGLGEFQFERVPPGDYVVSLSSTRSLAPPVEVHVEGETTAAVTIELSPTPITLAVADAGCDSLILASTSERYLDIENCAHGIAEFPDISPGMYKVSQHFSDYMTVTVTPSPSRQMATIVPPPPELVDPPPTPEPEVDPTPETGPEATAPDPADEATSTAP